jgi:DnaJ-class molecular chaperone
MKQPDPYDILGVSRAASQDEIKRAYRRLAKQHHPDRNQGKKDAEHKFKEVQAAYEILGDPKHRAQYDRFGAGGPIPEYANWQTGGSSRGQDVHVDFGSMGDLSSIFEQFFNRGAARSASTRGARRATRPPSPGANIDHQVSLTFIEAAHGATREVLLKAGLAQTSERIEFRVPAGVRDGQKIRVAGKGQEGAGGRGDLIITCHVQSHPNLRREGLDLFVDASVPFPVAALGGRADVPTLTGTSVVTIPPGTAGGARLRLRAMGIHDDRTGKTGDLYVIVRISVPRSLSPRAKQLVEELAEELRDSPAKNSVHADPAK